MRACAAALWAMGLLIGMGCGGRGASTPAPTNPPSTPWAWGVTTDDPTVGTAQQVEALGALPKRAMVRVVFDVPAGGHPTASDYLPSVASIAAVADVMGLPLDSSAMAATDLASVQSRINEYLAVMGGRVSVWEVGNEANGDWLGTGVMAKIEAMYDAVKARGKAAALTLYYETDPPTGHAMIPWIDANIPSGHRMRAGLDYVLVSYYEDENHGHRLTQAEVEGVFGSLADRFPNAKVGFGEFGWGAAVPPNPQGDAERADLLRRFYGYRASSVPRFFGGGFYWHFRQTMTPKTLPDWSVLSSLQSAGP